MSNRRCTLQHTAAHCNTLQHTATHCNKRDLYMKEGVECHIKVAHCNTLQHTATHRKKRDLYNTETHCNTLQHTATHCNTLQQKRPIHERVGRVSIKVAHCNILQHTATKYNTLQQKRRTHVSNKCCSLTHELRPTHK